MTLTPPSIDGALDMATLVAAALTWAKLYYGQEATRAEIRGLTQLLRQSIRKRTAPTRAVTRGTKKRPGGRSKSAATAVVVRKTK